LDAGFPLLKRKERKMRRSKSHFRSWTVHTLGGERHPGLKKPARSPFMPRIDAEASNHNQHDERR